MSTSLAPGSTDIARLTAAHWGTYRARMERGRLAGLDPFEEDSDPSPIGQGLPGVLDGPTRIRRPLVRQGWLEEGPDARTGRPDQRGCEPFVAVDWREAEHIVARELDRVRTSHGNSAIFGGSYGWASAGRFHHAQSQLHRFLNCLGGYTRSVNTYSFAAAEVVVPHILGSFHDTLNSVTSWSSITGNTDLFVAFGGIPLKNGQIGNGGVGRHGQSDAIAQAARSGVEFVNISPSRASVPATAAAEWLAPRPGTDVAILLGIAHVLLAEGLENRPFIERYTAGLAEVAAYLTGATDGIAKTAAWAASISGLEERDIRGLARRMAGGRTMISVSWSLTRQHYGEQPYWAAITVAALLGQIGLPGGGIGFGFCAVNAIGAQFRYLPHASLPQGANPVSSFIPVARIADMLLNPGAPFDYDGGRYRYPDIRLVYWAGGNPFHHHQDLNRLVRAWQRPETIICHDWCWTATARYADIVLPCTTPVERTDLALSARDPTVVAMSKLTEPVGDARNDYQIFAGIARHLGLEQAFTEGRSEAEWQRWIYEKSRDNLAELGLDLPPLETLWARGWARIALPDRPNIMLEAFIDDPERNPLATPSGRIELFSRKVANFDLPDCPGHAAWFEPAEWLGRSDAGPGLHLICVQPANKLHSQLDHGPISQRDKVDGREKIRISSHDAAANGICAAQTVRLFNHRGSCLAIAEIDPDLRPGVLEMSTGAWFNPDGPGPTTLCKAGNPNVLTPDLPTSRLAQGPGAHTCLVQIERFDGPAPPVTAYEPPRIITGGK